MKDTRQWEFVADMNFDGFVTISDIGLWWKWFFSYPGDLVVLLLTNNNIGRFFELSAADYGGMFSFLISLFVFVGIPIAIIQFGTIEERTGTIEERNENASPKLELQGRRIRSLIRTSIFSALLMYISLQLDITWLQIIAGLMFATGGILFFTSGRWNK